MKGRKHYLVWRCACGREHELNSAADPKPGVVYAESRICGTPYYRKDEVAVANASRAEDGPPLVECSCGRALAVFIVAHFCTSRQKAESLGYKMKEDTREPKQSATPPNSQGKPRKKISLL